MAESAAKRRAIMKYRKNAVRKITVTFYPKDKGILEWIDSSGMSRSAFIKSLIQSEIDGCSNG